MRNEETYRHGRTGQHLALGVSEELEVETFLEIRKYTRSVITQSRSRILPNRKRVYQQEKEQRIILELDWKSVNQSRSLSGLTHPSLQNGSPYTIIQVIISRLEVSSFQCSDITCSS